MIDNHVHTRLCKHATGEPFEYVETAIRSGMTEISFTDHIPLPDNFDLEHRMHLDELDLYINLVYQLRRQYPEIIIRLGIEADYYEGFEEFTSKILDNYDFDLVIMSIHFLHHWPKHNWVFDYNFPDKDSGAIYEDYLLTIINGIKTGLFDILGHVDIIKQPGHSLIELNMGAVSNVLDALKKQKMALEINTSGYRKKVGEPYPGYDWLDQIHRLDIPLSAGSDAHAPDQVGLNFSELYKNIQNAQITSLASFERRKRSMKSI
jgi:histidinol-phosphatase (PHP family)